MLNKLLVRYSDLLDRGTELYTGWRELFSIGFLSISCMGITILFTLLVLIEVANKLLYEMEKRGVLNNPSEEITPYKTLATPIWFSGIIILIFAPLGVYAHGKESDYKIYASDLIVTHEKLEHEIFNTYLATYNGEVLSPKESVTPLRIEHNQLYLVSFILNGVQYNDSSIYVTYSDKFPSDTLIPFDASFVKDLLPTDEQRDNKVNDYFLIDYPEEFKTIDRFGYMLRAKPLTEDYKVSLYHHLDDIDYIYNIRVESKTKREQ